MVPMISAQAHIAVHLLVAEYPGLLQVGFQVRATYGGAQFTDSGENGTELVRIYRARAEQLIELAFFRNQLGTELGRRLFHGIEEDLRRFALTLRQLEFVGQLEYVSRTGVAVEFRRFRETHAGPRQVTVHFRGRERFDFP